MSLMDSFLTRNDLSRRSDLFEIRDIKELRRSDGKKRLRALIREMSEAGNN